MASGAHELEDALRAVGASSLDTTLRRAISRGSTACRCAGCATCCARTSGCAASPRRSSCGDLASAGELLLAEPREPARRLRGLHRRDRPARRARPLRRRLRRAHPRRRLRRLGPRARGRRPAPRPSPGRDGRLPGAHGTRGRSHDRAGLGRGGDPGARALKPDLAGDAEDVREAVRARVQAVARAGVGPAARGAEAPLAMVEAEDHLRPRAPDRRCASPRTGRRR